MPETSARVCAVIIEETTERARQAIERATGRADLVELRLDYLRDFDFTGIDNLRFLLEGRRLPAIITCRAVSEGGRQAIGDDLRLRLLVEGARRWADYCDVEAEYYSQAAILSPDISRLIVSYHNFDKTPSDLDRVYDRVCGLPASIHKIVTRALSPSDALAVFGLLDRARNEGRNLIALAMGEQGLMTRVLGPSRGCYLTYCALADGRESAPGQITCKELSELYRVPTLSDKTSITGIIGSPVGHSASPAMHNAAFRAEGLDFVYLPFEVSDVSDFFARFVRPATREIDWRLRGLSVTIPHKQAVMPLLDSLDETARGAGAVNTVILDGERVLGYNTDVHGAIEPLERICVLTDESFAVIGAGGSARAVVYGLCERGARVRLFARDTERARLLVENFGVSLHPLESLAASDASVLINTTPVGMRGHSEGESVVPRSALAGRKIAYDLVYNPLETRFLKEARAEGCRTLSGIEMLIAQAALQFRLWTGRQAPLSLLRKAAFDRLKLATG